MKRDDGSDWVLGKGSFGVVKKAHFQGMDVAVKMIHDDATPDQRSKMKRLLKSESRALRLCRHTNVARFIEFSEDAVMLLTEIGVRGDVKKFISTENPTPSERFHIALGTANGMKALHAVNLLHLDLKLQNVVLSGDLTPKITDFGLNVSPEGHLSDMMSGTGSALPTAVLTDRYKAPELFEIDCRKEKPADVYSFSMFLLPCYDL